MDCMEPDVVAPGEGPDSGNTLVAAQDDGKTAFAAIQVLYIYVLAHIIMCYFYLSRSISSLHAGNSLDRQYEGTGYRPYRNDRGRGPDRTDSERTAQDTLWKDALSDGEAEAWVYCWVYLTVGLLLWLIGFFFAERRILYQNLSGLWSRNKVNLHESGRSDDSDEMSTWSYQPPSSKTLEHSFSQYIQHHEANGLRGRRDGTLYTPNYFRSLDAAGSPVTLA